MKKILLIGLMICLIFQVMACDSEDELSNEVIVEEVINDEDKKKNDELSSAITNYEDLIESLKSDIKTIEDKRDARKL